MLNKGSANRDDGRNSDEPPMSRLYIICNKDNTEDDIRTAFESFGKIENVWVVNDKKTGENKGVVYIKFSRTSDAARAMEEMNGKELGASGRAIKVLVANNRSQGSRRTGENEEEKYLRLFVLIPKDMNEDELTEHFGKYGKIDNVTIIRDKITKESKGFGYVKYSKFLDAALAFENSEAKFKAVFAEPKPRNPQGSNNDMDNYNSRDGGGMNNRNSGGGKTGGGGSPPVSGGFNDFTSNNFGTRDRRMSFDNMGSGPGNTNVATLYVACSPLVNQDQLRRLFDIIPGLDFCQINGEYGRNVLYATVVYNNQQSAACARDKIHGLEYPPGERLIVKPGKDLKIQGNVNPESIFNFLNSSTKDTDNSDSFCSVPLPAPASMADENAICAQRCFIVCVSQKIPSNILRNVFSRFGGLIDIYLLPNKNCGYAKYTTEASCRRAIETLHGAEICGTSIKVMEAEELGNDERHKRQRRDD